jgi:hypothetical protein
MKYDPAKEAQDLSYLQAVATRSLRGDGEWSSSQISNVASVWRSLERRDIIEAEFPHNPTSGHIRLTEYGMRVRRSLDAEDHKPAK